MSSLTSQRQSPDYERSPVVETVLGLQFDRLPKFGNAHLGAFWRSLDANEWPSVSDAPALEPQFERFGGSAKWSRGLQIQFTQDPASRIQIRNRVSDRMIQLQNGRLHFNWLRKEAENYPRYENVRAGFEEVLGRFVGFVAAEKVGEFRPNQWEVTYLNQIPKGTVWNSPSDWSFFLPLAGMPDSEGLLRGESFGGEWHYVIPEERGRLHVHWRHGSKADSDEQEMIVLTLTARGPIAKLENVIDGLNLGHDVIVRSFASLISKGANDYWGLKNASS